MKIGKTWNKLLFMIELAIFLTLLAIIVINRFFIPLF